MALGLHVTYSEGTNELFVRDLEDNLLAVLANDESGRARVADYLDQVFDLETCSWCVKEVPDATLTDMADGSRICKMCHRDNPDAEEADAEEEDE